MERGRAGRKAGQSDAERGDEGGYAFHVDLLFGVGFAP
jgi:hypothetical protein